MEESPHFNFFSPTFLIGFGAGIFIGVALGLISFALVRPPQRETTVIAAPTVTPTGTALPTPADQRPVTRTALDVRLGPGTAFAIIGTVSRGDRVNLVGRNDDADWVAIQFPPNSSGRGWLPVSGLDGVSGLNALAVVLPTPLARTITTPGFDSGGVGEGGSDLTPQAGVTGTGTPRVSGTPAPVTASAADLAVTRLQVEPDGRVLVTIGNRGPGDIVGFAIFVSVYDAASNQESLRASSETLAVGQTVTLATSSFVVDHEKQVFATVDPAQSIPDHDRSNNSLSATLAPPPTPTPAGTPN